MKSRGFTMAELLVYMALLLAGTLTIAGLELSASRAAFLERALVDLGMEADELGARFRDDVRQAIRVEDGKIEGGKGALLVLAMPGGGEVRWDLDGSSRVERTGPAVKAEGIKLVRRVYLKPNTVPSRVETFAHAEKLLLTRSGHSVRLDFSVAVARADEVTARRSYKLAACPIAEEVP
jgi:hypothetical protein